MVVRPGGYTSDRPHRVARSKVDNQSSDSGSFLETPGGYTSGIILKALLSGDGSGREANQGVLIEQYGRVHLVTALTKL